MTKNKGKEKTSSPINKIKLARAFDLCKEADIRYEDYIDRVLCLPRNAAKDIRKVAEEAAVAIASGIARRGAKPLVVTNMTFLQRAYDQISQDVCINKTPVTMLMNYSSFDGLTDVTHLGIFGLAAFTNIPNLVVLCPSSAEEYISMLDWSLDQKENPVFC